MAEAPIILLEVVGLFLPDRIHDRAVKRPVDKGNVLITSHERQNEYFRKDIIRDDLKFRKYSIKKPFPLSIVGVGYHPGYNHSVLEQLNEKVFYTPPQFNDEASPPITDKIKIHTHALGWIDSEELSRVFSSKLSKVDIKKASGKIDTILETDLLPSKPDYIVHIDDWSLLSKGLIRVYKASAEDLDLR